MLAYYISYGWRQQQNNWEEVEVSLAPAEAEVGAATKAGQYVEIVMSKQTLVRHCEKVN